MGLIMRLPLWITIFPLTQMICLRLMRCQLFRKLSRALSRRACAVPADREGPVRSVRRLVPALYEGLFRRGSGDLHPLFGSFRSERRPPVFQYAGDSRDRRRAG